MELSFVILERLKKSFFCSFIYIFIQLYAAVCLQLVKIEMFLVSRIFSANLAIIWMRDPLERS